MAFTDTLIDTRPLRTSHTFRRLWIGSAASAFGGQITTVAVLYQVWQLTGSPVWVGVIGVAHALPMIVFSLIGGSLADAIDRRRLVLATTIGSMVMSALLAAQAIAGWESLPVVLGLVAGSAACSAVGGPARRTFVPRVLERDQVAAGIALTHIGFQAAMLIGPAIAGLVIGGWGLPVCYLLDAATFGVALYGVASLPAMPPADPSPSGPSGTGSAATGTVERARIGAISAGFQYIARRPALGGSFLTDLAATVLAMPVALFPVINQERFGGNPETLGLLLSAIAVGGIGAGLLSGAVTRAPRPGTIQLAAAGAWGLALAGLGVSGALWGALAWLVVAGAADTVSVISRGSVVQLATEDAFRGRVSAVEQVVGVAGPELGNVRGGLLAGLTSATVALSGGGLLCVLGVALIAATHPALRRFTTAPAEPAPLPAVMVQHGLDPRQPSRPEVPEPDQHLV
jgi:MFS family permease